MSNASLNLRSGLASIRPGRLGLFVVAAVPLIATVVILGVVVAISFLDAERENLTLDNFSKLYTSSFAVQALLNTLGFALIAVVVACSFALPLAWIVERTDLWGARSVLLLMTVTMVVPSFFTAMGWVLMFHQRIGIVNKWLVSSFGIDPINIQSVVGMGWVMGISMTALAFVMMTASLRAADPALEEAAQIHGMRVWSRVRRVILPLVWPGILATALYVFTIGLAAFDIPATMGLPVRVFTFSTFVYSYARPSNVPPDYGLVGASSAVLLLSGLIVSLWYLRTIKKSHRYAVVRGKGYRPQKYHLNKRQSVACWLFITLVLSLKLVLPALMLIWVSLTPYLQSPSPEAFRTMTTANFSAIPWEAMVGTLQKTIIFAVLAPTFACILALAISWIVVRSGSRWAGTGDFLSFLPHIIPSLIFAVGVLLISLFWLPDWLGLYGSIYLILFAFVIERISFGTRMFNSTLLQLHNELEEAALVSGMGLLRTLWRVTLPLIAPTVVIAWIWIAMMAMRELTIPALLTTGPDNMMLPVMIYNTWQFGQMQVASAMTVVFLAGVTPIVAFYLWVTNRHSADNVSRVGRSRKSVAEHAPAGQDPLQPIAVTKENL